MTRLDLSPRILPKGYNGYSIIFEKIVDGRKKPKDIAIFLDEGDYKNSHGKLEDLFTRCIINVDEHNEETNS